MLGLEIVLGKAPLEQAPAGSGGEPRRRQQSVDEIPARTQYPRRLGRGEAASNLDGQIEEFIGIGQGPALRLLEGNASLGVEADLSLCFADAIEGLVDAAYASAGELAGEEERRPAVPAADHQRALRRGDVKHSGGEWLQRGGFHAAMIASPRRRIDPLGFRPMQEGVDRRWIFLAVFAAIAAVIVVVILIGRGGGSDDSASGTSAAGCKEVEAPEPKKVSLKAPPQTVAKQDSLKAVVETSCGTFDIALSTRYAPKTDNSFVYLSEEGFYDGLTFHRIAPGFVIQGGDPLGTGTGGPGYSVVEKPPVNFSYTKGFVAMAKSSAEPAGTSGSQFFIVTAVDAGLPPEYALVGKVSSGMDVVERIGKLGTPAEKPKQTVLIEKISIEKD